MVTDKFVFTMFPSRRPACCPCCVAIVFKTMSLEARGENGGWSFENIPICGLIDFKSCMCAAHSSYAEEFYWSIRVHFVSIVNN